MLSVDYDRLGLRSGDALLDLGCGAGRHAFEALRRGAHVTAFDRDAAELDAAAYVMGSMVESGDAPDGATWRTVEGDARCLPFEDGTFDRVIASEVLEHIEEDDVAMGELARVLRPGGTMAVTVPRYGPELVNWALSERYHAVEGGHIRIYRRSQLVSRLRDAGLAPSGTGYAHGLHSPYWWLKCLVGLERDHPAVSAYHRLLVWDITDAPVITRVAEKVLAPFIGKSLVVYLDKPVSRPMERAA